MYLGYEFVQGAPLRKHMNGTPMNTRHALDLAVQIADAVAEAHSHGVLHKDLRPDTILETGKGSAKVLDFGMSVWTRGGQTRAMAGAAPDSVGPEGMMTVAYMSPEQVLGGRVDGRTDVFSIGLIVYEMLTGHHPFAAPDAPGILLNITQRTPPPPTSLNPELPKMVDVVLARALNKAIERRTESASRLLADLRRCRSLVESGSDEPHAPSARPAASRGDVLHLEEERGGGGLWWLLALLGAGMAGAIFYWLR
jgi:serine/threonine-protein kinase